MVKNKNKIKASPTDNLLSVFIYTIVIIATVVSFYPLFYVVMASLSNSDSLMAHSGLLWYPLDASMAAYKAILTYPKIWSGLKNTLFILFGGLGVSLILTTLGAYFMTRKNVLFGKAFTVLILIAMYFQGGLVPVYLNIQDLGLYDSLWSVILVSGLSIYNMIIMRTNFQSIPASLEEAAQIDGANDFTILFKVILPLSKSVLAVMVLYYGVAYWNSWFYPAIFLQDATKIPLQLVLRDLLIQSQTQQVTENADSIEMTIKYATIVVSTLPLLVVYPFVQKHFVKGVMVGSVKG